MSEDQQPKKTVRMKRVVIEPQIILDILKTAELKKVQCVGLPADCQFRGMVHDARGNQLVVFAEHSSFEEVDVNKPIPELEVEFSVVNEKKSPLIVLP